MPPKKLRPIDVRGSWFLAVKSLHDILDVDEINLSDESKSATALLTSMLRNNPLVFERGIATVTGRFSVMVTDVWLPLLDEESLEDRAASALARVESIPMEPPQ